MTPPFRIPTLAALISAALVSAGPPPAAAQDGNGCAAVVSRWQEMAARENDGGHMDVAVFDRIQNEIDRASALCEGGQDAQAREAVAESKRRHGYPQ